MKFSETSSVEELQAVARFQRLREILMSPQYADHLKRPLAYWALPTDRRLPLAFLGRSLEDLLNTPFAELAKTPGIGRKKIASLVKLLARAANTDPADLPVDVIRTVPNDASAAADGVTTEDAGRYDPANISEVTWTKWCATVVRRGLENETVGLFAPSLKDVTRVIWSTPLGAYTRMTLAEIRAMRTHGEKRVHAVLDAFHSVQATVGAMAVENHLAVRILPRLIDRVEHWVGRCLQTAGVPGEEEIFENFVRPLLDQVRIDATQQIAALAENRLGLSGPITSVRQVARTMGLTRARVYQLLNEINDIMAIRWPLGRHQVYELREKFPAEAAAMSSAADLKQFYAAVELFYPGNRRGAAGPLEQAPVVDEEDREPAEPIAESAEAEVGV